MGNELTEEDTRLMFITPALSDKWDIMSQIRTEVYFTDGRVVVRGNITTRAKGLKADYILYYNSTKPLAIVEAKKYSLEVGDGMQQAIDYANVLDIPFAYSTNGKAQVIQMDKFPTPDELFNRYKLEKELSENEEKIINEPFYYSQGAKKPRYYQRIAINRTVEAIAKGDKNRLLLVMATGTGKTFTAFQIIHRFCLMITVFLPLQYSVEPQKKGCTD